MATTISIQDETKEKLEKFKSPGQSNDGVIRELINLQKEKVEKQVEDK